LDENGNTISYQYNDTWGRPTLAQNLSDGAEVQVVYSDSGTQPEITTCTLLNNSSQSWSIAQSLFDGYGHVTRNVKSGLQGTSSCMAGTASTAYVDTTYDGFGRVYTVSNPYYSSSDPTYGITTTLYDALGRVTSVTHPYPANSTLGYSYIGNVTTVTDENGNQWQQTVNAFNQLTSVLEPNGKSQSPPTLATTYTYDILGNLKNVNQTGVSGVDATRTRTFSYDGLSRLQTSLNVETGTTGYLYDANGNLIQKTDSRGVVTTYTYDALNRLISKTYSGIATPTACYQYDSSSVTNGIDRLANSWTQASGTVCGSSPYQTLTAIAAYDAEGRVLSEQQCVMGHCTSAAAPTVPALNCASLSGGNGLQYCYDLGGHLLAYSNGVTSAQAGNIPQAAMAFSQTYDAMGRLATIGSSWVNSSNPAYPATLFTAEGYTPFNTFSSWLLGGTLWTSRNYDPRLRICSQLSMLQQTTAPECQ